jgi:MFS family permease
MKAVTPVPGTEIRASDFMPSIYLTFFTNMIDMLGFGLLLPLLPYYYVDLLPASMRTDPDSASAQSGLYYGMVTGSFSAGQFIGSFFMGVISDTFGRKVTLMVGLMGTAGLFTAVAWARSIWVLIGLRAALGMMAGTGGVCASFIADVTTKEERPKFMGLLGGAVGLGLVMGPVIGGGIGALCRTPQMAFRVASYGASGMCLVNFTLAMCFFKESPVFLRKRQAKRDRAGSSMGLERISVNQGLLEGEGGGGEDRAPVEQKKPSVWRSLAQVDLLLLCLATFFFNTVFASVETSLPLLLKGRYGSFKKPTYAGAVFAVYGVILIIVQVLLFNRSIKAMGLRFVCLLWVVVSAVAAALIPVGDREGETLGAVALLAVGQGFVYPAMSVMTSLLTDNHQGSVQGIRQSFAALCRITGPLAAGFLFDIKSPVFSRYRHTLPFWVTGTLCAVVSFLLMLPIRPKKASEFEKAQVVVRSSSKDKEPLLQSSV